MHFSCVVTTRFLRLFLFFFFFEREIFKNKFHSVSILFSFAQMLIRCKCIYRANKYLFEKTIYRCLRFTSGWTCVCGKESGKSWFLWTFELTEVWRNSRNFGQIRWNLEKLDGIRTNPKIFGQIRRDSDNSEVDLSLSELVRFFSELSRNISDLSEFIRINSNWFELIRISWLWKNFLPSIPRSLWKTKINLSKSPIEFFNVINLFSIFIPNRYPFCTQ